MPVHGEFRHKIYHARLAEKTGIPKSNIFILDDGEVLEISDGGVVKGGSVTSGRIYVDGKGVGDVEDMVLRDRRRLAHDGIVLILIGIEKLTGNIVSGPDIMSRGFVFEDASQETISDVRELGHQHHERTRRRNHRRQVAHPGQDTVRAEKISQKHDGEKADDHADNL